MSTRWGLPPPRIQSMCGWTCPYDIHCFSLRQILTSLKELRKDFDIGFGVVFDGESHLVLSFEQAKKKSREMDWILFENVDVI